MTWDQSLAVALTLLALLCLAAEWIADKKAGR